MSLWEQSLSAGAKSLKPSPIREILHVIRQPEMISFAGGMPDPQAFPVKEFHDASSILKEHGKEVLQYGATEGYAPLKEFLASWLAPRLGRTPKMEEILITTGSTQVVDLLNWATVNENDAIVVESPTFLGSTLNMHNHKATFLTVPCDAEGMVVEKLPEIIENAKEKGQKISYIYIIVNFHNPLGCTLSLERRKKIVEISQKYGIPLLEDDPYGYVRFDGEHLPSLYSLDKKEGTVYAGSFSKILAPGTRVAWCVGPEDIIRKMAVFKQGVDVCSSVVAQALVYEYCRKGYLDTFLPKIIEHYRKKRDAMEKAFQKHLPQNEVSYVKPEGGFFYWLHTPHIAVDPLFDKAIDKKVAFVKGQPFYPLSDGGNNHFRMCYTFASSEQIDEGCSRLGKAMQELL